MTGLQNWFTNNIHLPPSPYPFLLSTSLGLLIASEATSFHLGTGLFKICASLSFLSAGLGLLENNWRNLLEWLRKPAGASHGSTYYSLAIVLGLGFSSLGDIFLIPSAATYYGLNKPRSKIASRAKNISRSTPKGEEWREGEVHEAATVRFKLGTLFFALAHMAYAVGFLSSATSNWRLSLLETITDPVRFRVVHFVLSFTFGIFVAHRLGALQRPQAGMRGSALVVPGDLRSLVRGYIGIIMTMVSVATATDDGWQKIVGAWMFMISDLFVAMDVFGSKRDLRTGGLGRPGWKSRSIGWIVYFWAQMILAGTV